MKKFALVLTMISMFSAASLPADSVRKFAHETSDLKPDQNAIWGKLENGFRYVIVPNKYPVAERASMRLYIDAGSLMEEDDQRGMAHFLEHLAFNGSKNFPAGTMVETFQRMGMAFGADTNAHTSFKETVYKLELPRVDEAMLSEGLSLFRDDLDGLLLGEAEIEKERGIILSEKLARDSIESRIMEAGFKFSMPDSILPERFPIGVEETISTMPRQRFVDFYETWYTPKRAVLVVVGDVDVALVERLINKYFASAEARRGDSPDPKLGKIEAGRGLVAHLHTEMQSAAVEMSLENLKQITKQDDNALRRRHDIIRSLADSMLNLRFSEMAKKEDAPFIEAQSYRYRMFDFVEINGITARAEPEQWQESLSAISQELRRAVQHGFSKEEFERAKADYVKQVRLRAEQKDTRKNADLANQMVRQLGSGMVFTDPLDDLKRVEQEMQSITPIACLESLRDNWDTRDLHVFLGGKLQLDNASRVIAETLVRSSKVPVEPLEQGEAQTFAYTDFGVKGEIVADTFVEDLAIHQVQFGNGVRVNLKKTDFEKNSIRIAVNFGSGKLEMPKEQAGLIPYAQSTFIAGGLQQHSADDLRKIFSGKEVAAEFAIGDDAFVLAGKTTPNDFLQQAQLLTAYLLDPGYRDEADRQLRRNLASLYQELNHTAEGVIQNKVAALVRGDDPRFGYPVKEVLEQRQLSEVKAWLTPALIKGYMEISIIGDFEKSAVLEALAKTFGALPERAQKAPKLAALRQLHFPKDLKQKTFEFTTEIPRAWAVAFWPTDDMSNIQRTRRLGLLGSIVDDRLRLKIREQLGETYSPVCYHQASDAFTGFGILTAMASLKPEQVPVVEKIFLEIGAELGRAGITDDEFQRAIQPQLQQVIQTRRDNRYWMQRVLFNCQSQPERLEWARSMEDDVKSMTREQLEEVAKIYLAPERALTVSVLPIEQKSAQ